jgi:hypothetical protein
MSVVVLGRTDTSVRTHMRCRHDHRAGLVQLHGRLPAAGSWNRHELHRLLQQQHRERRRIASAAASSPVLPAGSHVLRRLRGAAARRTGVQRPVRSSPGIMPLTGQEIEERTP